jgi:hypothetical protein
VLEPHRDERVADGRAASELGERFKEHMGVTNL